jgi:hypothetical protein
MIHKTTVTTIYGNGIRLQLKSYSMLQIVMSNRQNNQLAISDNKNFVRELENNERFRQ